MTTRTFTHAPAVRLNTPCAIGIIGQSRTGKTYSAHRLAQGMRRVVGGEVWMIDTEERRGLHYSYDETTKEGFKFTHIPFSPPYGSLDYLAALTYAKDNGAKVVITDSMSHEHIGVGGMLDEHERVSQELAKKWDTNLDKSRMAAWGVVKPPRTRMISAIGALNMCLIFCFRAKDKTGVIGGKPVAMGDQPIGGDEFPYEMLVNFYLPMGGEGGVPSWNAEHPLPGVKIPRQFEALLRPKGQLNETIGESIAQWCAGTKPLSKKEKIASHFASFGISEAQLETYLGHPIEAMTDEERAVLGPITKAIKAGTTDWATATAKPEASK